MALRKSDPGGVVLCDVVLGDCAYFHPSQQQNFQNWLKDFIKNTSGCLRLNISNCFSLKMMFRRHAPKHHFNGKTFIAVLFIPPKASSKSFGFCEIIMLPLYTYLYFFLDTHLHFYWLYPQSKPGAEK